MADEHGRDRTTEDERRPSAALLWLILAAALLLRLYGLGHRGILLWDEGSYLMEGRFIATGVKAAAWKLAGKLPWVEAPEQEQVRALVSGIAPGIMGKPGHAGLVALMMLVFGDTDYAPALVSVLCSLVMICLVWRLGAAYCGPIGAVASAGLLAVSPYMLFYGRVGLAELDFALGGLLVMLLLWHHWSRQEPPRSRSLLWLGAVTGLAFLLNYRGFILLALCMLWLAALMWHMKKPLLHAAGALLLVAAGFALPLLATEGLYHVGTAVARSVHPTTEMRTYFQQLHWLASNHGSQPPTAANLGTYPYLFAIWEGPGLVLLLIGSAIALARRRWQDLLVLSFFYLPMLQWSVRHDAYARLAVLNLPMYGLLAGLAVAAMWQAGRMQTARVLSGSRQAAARAAAVALATGFLLWAGWQGLPILQAQSAHEQALAMTADLAQGPLVDTNPGVAVVYEQYYDLHDVIRLPEERGEALEALRAVRDRGGKYLVTDMQRFVSGTQLMNLARYRASACHIIDTHCIPIWQTAHMAGLFRHFCFEHNWGRAQTVELYAGYRDEAEMIRVYLLDAAIAALDR